MKNKDIEKSIRRAIVQAPTVDFNKLINKHVNKMSEHDGITRQQIEQKPKRLSNFYMAFASCFILFICFSSWFIQFKMPASVIALDVNPSIELVTNKQDKILSVKALNDDAKEVIGEKNYKNDDLNSAVDDIIKSMINHGYLNKEKNIIMVSVENKDLKRAGLLAKELDNTIRNVASVYNISTYIFRQTFTEDKDASVIAEKYSVSMGKIKLIKEIILVSDKFTVAELAHKTIKELILLADENAIDLQDIIKFDNDYLKNNMSDEDTLISDIIINNGKEILSKDIDDDYDNYESDSGNDGGEDENSYNDINKNYVLTDTDEDDSEEGDVPEKNEDTNESQDVNDIDSETEEQSENAEEDELPDAEEDSFKDIPDDTDDIGDLPDDFSDDVF